MATTTNFGWETPDDTDLVKDGAAAMRTLGSAIDTSMMDLKGGTTGQVLSKASNTDMDFTWVAQDDSNAIQNAIVDAKGDLISATAADTPARLAVGTNGQVLTADSTASTGLKWATPNSSDMVRIATTTFSASSGVVLTDCFTSTYKHYFIVVNATTSSEIDIVLRLRASGTDYSTADQGNAYVYSLWNNTAAATGSTTRTSMLSWGSNIFLTYSGFIYNPQESGITTTATFNLSAASGTSFVGYKANNTNSYTSLNLFPASSTFTGEVSIYGIKRA